MVGVAVGTGAICVLALGQINSQQNQSKPTTPPLATNWIGYVVFGAEDSMDRIAPKPGVFPTTNPEVEIGLRSDGIVVWRRAPVAR